MFLITFFIHFQAKNTTKKTPALDRDPGRDAAQLEFSLKEQRVHSVRKDFPLEGGEEPARAVVRVCVCEARGGCQHLAVYMISCCVPGTDLGLDDEMRTT